MRPPQDRPTRHAVSSATPNSSIRGAPLAITSAASSTTAPSTQPPETEPRKLPSPSMTRWEPTGLGAEPQVSTTVAIATSRPASRHDSAAASTSSSRVSIASASFRAENRHREERSDVAIHGLERPMAPGLLRFARNDGSGPTKMQPAPGSPENGPAGAAPQGWGAHSPASSRSFRSADEPSDPDSARQSSAMLARLWIGRNES